MAPDVKIERYAPLEGVRGAVTVGDMLVPVVILDHDWYQAGLGDKVDPDSSVAREAALIAATEDEHRREEYELEDELHLRVGVRHLLEAVRRLRHRTS